MSQHRRSADLFVVTTRIGIDQFDDPRQARARLKSVMAEVKRIRSTDRRLRRARLVRDDGAPSSFLLELTIDAPTGWQAFEIGSAVVRASIHTVGDTTAGWECIEPQLQVGDMMGHHRPVRPTSWAEVNAMANRRAMALPALPPIHIARTPAVPASVATPARAQRTTSITGGVIDLR